MSNYRGNYIHVISIFCLLFSSQILCAFNKCPHNILGTENELVPNQIIELHNTYRHMAVEGSIAGQPRAASVSVNLLNWDHKLEQLARELSRTCEFEHVEVKTAEFPQGLGQNLYRSCSNKRRNTDWNKVIRDWFNEHKKYHFPEVPNMLTGHYTQMVWGRTKLIGCAHTEYFQTSKPKVPYCILYVCHYAPRGNIKGEAPYRTAGTLH